MLVCERVIALRAQLTADGLDAGPVTIAVASGTGGAAGSLDLHDPADPASGGVDHARAAQTAPHGSYTRFQASQPNEMWQSDFTHSRLLGGSDVEILNWLDDHSRYLLSCTAHQPVSGDQVVAVFLAAGGCSTARPHPR